MGLAPRVTNISASQWLLVAGFLYGVPAAVWCVRRIAARMKAEEVETRVLTPLVILYLVSVLSCVALSALKVGQEVGPDGTVTMLVGWNTTVKIFLFGTAWLIGSAFVLARDMPPHNVYKIYYMVVGMYVTRCVFQMQRFLALWAEMENGREFARSPCGPRASVAFPFAARR